MLVVLADESCRTCARPSRAAAFACIWGRPIRTVEHHAIDARRAWATKVDRVLVARVNGILTIEPAVRMHRLGDVADEVRHDPQPGSRCTDVRSRDASWRG